MDLFFRDFDYSGHMLSDDRPIVPPQADGARAVGHSPGLLLVQDQASFTERASRVVTKRGLGAENLRRGIRPRDALGYSPDQPASSDRDDDRVKPPAQREQFVPKAGVTLDDERVVVSARDISLAGFRRRVAGHARSG